MPDAAPVADGLQRMPHRRRRFWRLVALGLGALAVSVFVSLLFGAFGPFDARAGAPRLTVADVWLALLGAGEEWKRSAILDIRLPRVLLAGLVGGVLALSGTTLQAVFRNPLAEPFILGVSTGAALGASLHIVLGIGGSATFVMLPLFAFAGGLLATFSTYAIAGTGGGVRTETLLLAGVAMNSLLTALLLGFLFFAGEQFRSLFFWILGGFGSATWPGIALLGLAFVGGGVWLALRAERLNVLLLGDDQAASLGVDVAQEKRMLLLVATLLASVSVAMAGAIGFVGLIVPHLLRLLLGGDHRALVPAAALFGAAFLIWADLGARTVLSVGDLPIGVVTALCGAPFFLFLLYRRRYIHGLAA